MRKRLKERERESKTERKRERKMSQFEKGMIPRGIKKGSKKER